MVETLILICLSCSFDKEIGLDFDISIFLNSWSASGFELMERYCSDILRKPKFVFDESKTLLEDYLQSTDERVKNN
jgi:hypothetical protein